MPSANQSIAAIPPNIEQPEVLKRFLRTLVERLDTVLGLRGSAGDAAVTVGQLQPTTNTLGSTVDTLSSVAGEVDTLSELLVTVTKDIADNVDNIADNATDIATLEDYWTHKNLSPSYYNFNNALWATLVGNGEFSTDGANITNAPYTPVGGTSYRNFIHSVPTINGGVVQRLVVVDSGTTLRVFQRAGNSPTEVVTIGWIAL